MRKLFFILGILFLFSGCQKPDPVDITFEITTYGSVNTQSHDIDSNYIYFEYNNGYEIVRDSLRSFEVYLVSFIDHVDFKLTNMHPYDENIAIISIFEGHSLNGIDGFATGNFIKSFTVNPGETKEFRYDF